MPSKSKKQEKLMSAATHNKEFADKVVLIRKLQENGWKLIEKRGKGKKRNLSRNF